MVGFPLGNYTSQMFANIYLNECENRLSGGVRGEKHTKCYPLLD